MKRKFIIGAAVASMMAVGATGMAVASSDGTAGTPTPEESVQQGMTAPSMGVEDGEGPGGKHAEKMVEMEQLIGFDEIGLDQAGQIATDAAPGEIVEIKLKEKDGYAVYEVETFANSTINEFYINAQDGSILEQKVEGGEESGPMAQDDDEREMSEGSMGDDERGPESEMLPNTGGEEQN